MKLTIKQTQALDVLEDQVTTELLFGGGAGGGKSILGCYWQIKRRLRYPGTRGFIGRAKFKALKDTTLKSFMEVARMQGLIRGEHFKLTSAQDKENPNCIMFFNGSMIYLRDMFLYPADPEFDDLGSLEITDAFIDEANQVSLKGKNVLKSRMRYMLDENGIVPKLLMTCNPAKNWTYRQFYLPNKQGDLPEYRYFIQSLLNDNKHISRHYKANLLTLDKNSKERLLYGNWEYDSDPSALISYDAIKDYFNPIHIPREGEKYITVDIARKGKDTTVFRVWHGWLVIHRYMIPKSGLVEVVDKAKNLMQRFGVPLSHVIGDEDGVGGGFVDFLGSKGFINNASPKKELVGNEWIQPNYRNLKSQCTHRIAIMIENREIGEICEHEEVIDQVTQEMEQIKQRDIDKDNKIEIVSKDQIKEHLGRSPDDWDSIMMRYFFELEPKVFTF